VATPLLQRGEEKEEKVINKRGSCLTSSIQNKTFGVAMIVAGTCIGAGMLALPVSTAASGFTYSTLAFCFTWIMMMLSALLMLEASMWYSHDANLITMMKSTWGTAGAMFTWTIYVLFLYALMTAYASGASGILGKGLAIIGFPETWGPAILAAIFGVIVYMGAAYVDWVNRFLMIGLFVAYGILVFTIVPKVSPDLLSAGHPKYLWSVGPLLVTSFGFHLSIPSLKSYLEGDAKRLRLAILCGGFIPLVVYLLWELLILGVIPLHGEESLMGILHGEQHEGKHAVIELTRILSTTLNNPQVTFFSRVFGLCAILTSFIGVSLGLFDFFADGFKMPKTHKNKMILAVLTFLPPILIAAYYPRFISALHYAGLFAAVLLILLPALIVWKGRYGHAKPSHYRVSGGKPLVIGVCLFGVAILALEVLHHLNELPMPSIASTILLVNLKKSF
jgi:tyrosine-specific transport protein